MLKYIVLCAVILFFPFWGSVNAQQIKNVQLQKSHTGQQRNSSAERLAMSYYRNGEFEKAASLFSQLYNQNPTNFYYNYLFNSLVKLKNFKEAEKLAKKQNRRSGMPRYKIDLAYVYDMAGNKKRPSTLWTS